MDLAYVSPLPPIQSGVADYGAALLPHLRPHFEQMIAVVKGYTPRLPPQSVDAVYDADQNTDWWQGGRVVPLYHMGNHIRYHHYIYKALQRFPGITVLHDGNLLPFIHGLTLTCGQNADFVREAGFERGRAGIVAAWNSMQHAQPLDPHEYPMLARVVRSSLGVIVHNQYLRDRVREVCPAARVAVIPLLDMTTPEPAMFSRHHLTGSLGLDHDNLLIGAFGFIAPSKRLDQALRAFARIQVSFPQARFLCVGQMSPGYDLEATLTDLDLKSSVRVTGYVSEDVFTSLLHAVDVGINLRYPTWGESSASLISLLASKVPTIVTNAGAFAELPDEAVLKVSMGEGEVDAIEIALRELLSNADKRATIGSQARQYVVDQCQPAQIANQYAAFIRSIVCASST